MILPLSTPFSRKRWTYKLSELGLDPFKFPDDESKEYNKDSEKVGNLVAPNIIVSEELQTGFGRKYALFENYVQVYHLCNWFRNKGDQPHLYEICPYYMKIHFDIDVKKDDLENNGIDIQTLEGDLKYYFILRHYLKSIRKVFAKLFPLNYDEESFHHNILVFEAHRNDKISFHIIVDGFYLPCHECFVFFQEVVDDIKNEGMVLQAGFADSSVYKKNQAFRMFGSNKATMKGITGTKRIYNGPELDIGDEKTFSRESMVQSSFKNEPCDPELVNIRILERSLLSHTMGGVRLTLIKDKVAKKNQSSLYSGPDFNSSSAHLELSDDTVKSIMETFYRSPYSKTETGERAFVFEKVTKQGLVCVRRLKPGFCKICERTHESENSWLVGNITGDVDFICRRAQESKMKGGIKINVGNYVY